MYTDNEWVCEMINPKEALSVVDENDNAMKALLREEVHQQMLLHRLSHIWIVNEKGQVLSQKRSMEKDKWPGMWECWFGGHVLANETYLETAITETQEEVGLTVTADELHFFAKRKLLNTEERVFVSIYGLQRSLDITTMQLEAEEVELVQWFTIEELKKIYQSGDDQWVRYGHELEMLTWLETAFVYHEQ
jgi:isopentenyldiphosphate isomerase